MNKRLNYSDQGIVIGKRNYKETDRMITVLTKNNGKLTLLAKGVRKTNSRKRGHIEIGNLIRFSAVDVGGMDVVTEVFSQKTAKFDDLRKISLLYYFCEVVSKITKEKDKQNNIFDLLNSEINLLTKTENNLKELKEKFIKQLLTISGYYDFENKIINPDAALEEVVEKQIYSKRVGKRLFRK